MTGRRVHIVDDDAAVLDALATRLAFAGIDVSAWNDPERFLGSADLAVADALLLDVRMPTMGGLDVLAEVAGRAPSLAVVMITGHGDVALAVRAMKAGAFDFIEKPFPDRQLMAAVDAAVAATRHRRATPAAAVRRAVRALTRRETEVLRMILDGKPNKLIAFELGCSQRTVEIHRARIMKKMAASSLAELVRNAVLAGIVPPAAAAQ